MDRGARTLPDFDNPPAVETVMGVYFLPLKGWKLPHFGLFWQRIRKDFPTVEVRGPIIAGPPGEPRAINLLSAPQEEVTLPVRCWFRNRNETTLVQLQDSCFFHNWRRETNSLPYLHYDELRPTFEREWENFCEFATQEGMGVPNVWRCEVTYVNHIDRGLGWNDYGDLSRVVVVAPGPPSKTSFLPTTDSVTFQCTYPMGGPEAQLRIQLQPVVRKSDGKDTLQLTLTATCRPESSELAAIVSSLNQAREWVVKGFTDFTTPGMHHLWRRRI